jgi:hypothetical protein
MLQNQRQIRKLIVHVSECMLVSVKLELKWNETYYKDFQQAKQR